VVVQQSGFQELTNSRQEQAGGRASVGGLFSFRLSPIDVGKADIERSSLWVSFHPKQNLADSCAVARRVRLRPRGFSGVRLCESRSFHRLQQLPRFTQQGLNLLALGDRIPSAQAVLEGDISLRGLLWHAPPYRIRAGNVGDAPGDIRRQPCAHSHFEQFSITRSHRRDRLANGRGHHAGRPKVFEVNKRSLHSDLSNFDCMEIGIHPQAPQRLYSGHVGTGRERGSKSHGMHFGMHQRQRMSTTHHIPDVGGGCAAWTNDSRHLGNSLNRIGNEENHQRHNGRIEAVFAKRKR
jgi:hypothetical protein